MLTWRLYSHEHMLFARRFQVRGNLGALALNTPYYFQSRHQQKTQRGIITAAAEDRLTITLDEPMRAITPGQYMAIYDGTENRICLAGFPIHCTLEDD